MSPSVLGVDDRGRGGGRQQTEEWDTGKQIHSQTCAVGDQQAYRHVQWRTKRLYRQTSRRRQLSSWIFNRTVSPHDDTEDKQQIYFMS